MNENNNTVGSQKMMTAEEWKQRQKDMSAKEWQLRINFTDEMGATRHYLTLLELKKLYKVIEELEADLTRDEFTPHSYAFADIKGLLHKRMKLAFNKIQGK